MGSVHVPWTTYYKPMSHILYISSEQGGGLIMLIYEYTILYLYLYFEGGGLVIHHGLIIRSLWLFTAAAGGVQFCSATYRLFKPASQVIPAGSDTLVQVVYKGKYLYRVVMCFSIDPSPQNFVDTHLDGTLITVVQPHEYPICL